MNVWLYWRKFIHNSLSVIPLISHLKVFVSLGCFLRVIEASATPLCDVIRTKRKNFSLVENCMLFKTIRSAFILTLVVLLKKSRILYPKRHGIFHSKALHMPCREWWSMRTRSQWGKILLVFWTMPICVSHDETHSSAKTFQTKDEWGRKQFVLVKTS